MNFLFFQNIYITLFILFLNYLLYSIIIYWQIFKSKLFSLVGFYSYFHFLLFLSTELFIISPIFICFSISFLLLLDLS